MSAAAAGCSASRSRRMGAEVVGIDPAAENIEVARLHASEAGLAIDYRATTAEALAAEGERLRRGDRAGGRRARHRRRRSSSPPAARMVKPGGLMIAATINRTMKAYALAIVGAEYILRWLAARHPRLRKAGETLRARRRLPRRRPVARRRDRRHVHPHRRPLAPHQRHGRQLHDGRREAAVGWAKARRAVPTRTAPRRGHASLCPPYDAHQNKSYPHPENRSYTHSPSPLAEGRLPEAFVGRSGEWRLGFRLASGGLEARNPPAGESRPPTPCARPRVRERTCPPTAFLPGWERGTRRGSGSYGPGRQPHGAPPAHESGCGTGKPKTAAAGASTSALIRTTRPAFIERPPPLVSREGENRERRVIARLERERGKENLRVQIPPLSSRAQRSTKW